MSTFADLRTLLEETARREPRAPAVVSPGRPALSWSGLAEQVAAAVSRLRTGETGSFEPDDSPVHKEHRRTLRRYRPGRYLGRVCLVFVEQGPPRAAEDALASLRAIVDDDVEVRWLTGSHRDLTEARSAPQLAAILGDLLARAGAEGCAP